MVLKGVQHRDLPSDNTAPRALDTAAITAGPTNKRTFPMSNKVVNGSECEQWLGCFNWNKRTEAIPNDDRDHFANHFGHTNGDARSAKLGNRQGVLRQDPERCQCHTGTEHNVIQSE